MPRSGCYSNADILARVKGKFRLSLGIFLMILESYHSYFRESYPPRDPDNANLLVEITFG